MKLTFRELEADDVPRLSPYFALRPGLTCDSVIFDSYLWRDYYQMRYAVVDEAAVLMKIQEGGETFGALPVCRGEDLPHYFAVWEQYYEENFGEKFRIYGADERALKILNLDPDRYAVRELPDQADYIYDAESLRTLNGRRYHKKKNNLNAFLRTYGERWEYRRLSRESKPQIWEFLDRWQENRENAEIHLAAEVRGLHDYLNHMDRFDAAAAGIYVDGRLEAFTVGSYEASERMSIVHVEKANAGMRGLYTLINQQFQVREFPDALLVNREDDVGLPGLRQAKESYHPILRAKKYRIVHL